MSPQKRVCDNCSEATALLYCRADSAKLCFLCDREIHSANQLFSKHTRSPLCDACDFSPASIFCSTESSVLCQNCDWERHNLSLSLVHNRRPLEGFTGCPSVSDLMVIVGFEEVGNKALFLSDENDDADEFSDFLVWDDASHVFNFDDLIGSTNSAHEFQAMGGPPLPLPKNRNAACGQYKEDILSQLREMAKSEPNSNHEAADAEPLINYRSLVPEQNVQPRHMCTGFAHDAEQIESPDFGAGDFQWFSDGGQAANQFCISNSFKRSYIEESPVVPEKHSDIGGSVSHANDGNEAQSLHVIISENSSALPKVSPHELNSQERDSALSRYKEKKKTRRYDKHIRYESRKVRAESRVRIKGRFAKMDH